MNEMALKLLLAVSTIGAIPADPTDVRVVGISDGDTMTVLTEDKQSHRIRLAEIDAPESRQDFGQRAKQALSDLCFGKSAKVNFGNTDQYGRTVSRVTCNGVDVQAHMVANGMAWVYERYAQDKNLHVLQRQAQERRLGLWSHPNPIPPWEWRAAKRKASL
jgi:endonuclease YncB( thermonuclease family)